MTFPSFESPQEQQQDRWSAEDAQGHRLVIVPIAYIPKVTTSQGREPDAIKVNVINLTEPGGPKERFGVLWFGGRLIKKFRNKYGRFFLGHITKVDSGGYRPWEFFDLSQDPQTVQAAQQYLAANPSFAMVCEQDVVEAAQDAERFAQQQQQAQQWQQPTQQQQPQQWQQQPQQQPWIIQGQQQPVPQQPAAAPAPMPPQQPAPQQQVQQQPLQPMQQAPAPSSSGPAPLPPQTAEDPWPAQQLPPQVQQGPQVVEQQPLAPMGQGGTSMMDRLRAQRGGGNPSILGDPDFTPEQAQNDPF